MEGHQPISQHTHQATHKPVNESRNPSATQTTDQPINRLVNALAIKQPINQPIKQSINQHVDQSLNQTTRRLHWVGFVAPPATKNYRSKTPGSVNRRRGTPECQLEKRYVGLHWTTCRVSGSALSLVAALLWLLVSGLRLRLCCDVWE